jgi:RNA recognition motif-containing protein
MNIHISNLHFNVIERDLQRMFSAFGEVSSVEVVRDQLNYRSRGRAFVQMPVELEAHTAIGKLDKSLCKGKVIRVAEVAYHPGKDAWDF